MRERSSGSDSLESLGSTLGGRPASFCKALGVLNRRFAWPLDLGDQVGILPDRHAVLAPIEPERPARQALARIPFALSVMQQAAGREAGAQAADQIISE